MQSGGAIALSLLTAESERLGWQIELAFPAPEHGFEVRYMDANRVVTRKKLIEVALPLEAINAASAREKSIRHSHPARCTLVGATSARCGASRALRPDGG